MLLDNRSASYESGFFSERFGGAFGASLCSHAALAGLLYLLMTLPASTSRLADVPRRTLDGLVFLNQVAASPDSGGGGGGGDHSQTPPRRLETPGMAAFAVPAHRPPPPLTPPDEIPKEQPHPPIPLVLPLQSADAGQITAIGVLHNPSVSPTTSLGSGKNGPAGTGDRDGLGDGHGPGVDAGRDGGIGGNVYQLGDVDPPVVLREVRPDYTPDAMRARIQGEVLVSAVVLPDGSVTRLRVLRSLDAAFGLDEQALKAVRQWRFKPGRHGGQPVAVQVAIAVGFTMR